MIIFVILKAWIMNLPEVIVLMSVPLVRENALVKEYTLRISIMKLLTTLLHTACKFLIVYVYMFQLNS